VVSKGAKVMKKIVPAVFVKTFVGGLFALAEEPRNTGKEHLMNSRLEEMNFPGDFNAR
jgi:hypothetical protein